MLYSFFLFLFFFFSRSFFLSFLFLFYLLGFMDGLSECRDTCTIPEQLLLSTAPERYHSTGTVLGCMSLLSVVFVLERKIKHKNKV